jgi:hypothetical protein
VHFEFSQKMHPLSTSICKNLYGGTLGRVKTYLIKLKHVDLLDSFLSFVDVLPSGSITQSQRRSLHFWHLTQVGTQISINVVHIIRRNAAGIIPGRFSSYSRRRNARKAWCLAKAHASTTSATLPSFQNRQKVTRTIFSL